MNIFWLDDDLTLCAQYHCDKHVNKMLIESVQLLCAALHEYSYVDYTDNNGIAHLTEHNKYYNSERFESVIPYKSTHKNHPCAIWARDTNGNFKRLCLLATKLANEYSYRYGKHHKTIDALTEVLKLTNMNRELPFNVGPALRPPLCMPLDELGIEQHDDVILSYRQYYQHKYNEGMDMRWTKRDIPHWLNVK